MEMGPDLSRESGEAGDGARVKAGKHATCIQGSYRKWELRWDFSIVPKSDQETRASPGMADQGFQGLWVQQIKAVYDSTLLVVY